MLQKGILVTLLVVASLTGWLFWRITGHRNPESIKTNAEISRKLAPGGVKVDIGGEELSQEEIDFEIHLEATNLKQSDSDGSGDEDTFEEPPEDLQALKNYLISGLIERKLLFRFIALDNSFNISDPSRYVRCLTEWQKALGNESKFLTAKKNQDFLKARLCEQDILGQYLKEKVFEGISVSQDEMKEYFDQNRAEFYRPKKVVIRQIVLPDEARAKNVRTKVTRYNFRRIAKSESTTPEAEKEGLLGPFAKGEMPRVFDVAFDMKRGEISQILKSTYGFHIMMLEKTLPASYLSFQKAKTTIEKLVKESKQKEEYERWVEQALYTIPVKVSRAD